MFIHFFLRLRQHGLPVSIKEYLHLLEALDRDVTAPDLEDFYYLARTTLIKHEGHWDAFDVLFGEYFRNQIPPADDFWAQVPEDWLRAELAKHLSPEDIAAIETMGGLDALMERFRELLDEQDEAHAGGNRFIGTGGTSPFGNGGYNPEGFRQGGESRHRQAIKVWDRRQYANLNDQLELNTRNLKVILKGLRAFTREGRAEELDLDDTIRRTSENGGMLDLRLRPSRRNNVKVLLLLDAGGSMDDYVTLCSELFSAARYEFKHLEAYYFHNCLYEYVWRDNNRRFTDRISTWDLLHT
ncbi:MAG: VWA domain-containing protein, partial [Bacteroidetes bacterium]